MIKNWKLTNFKSVKGTRTLAFAPLTIFAGANSSGKSTILQSILLTAQTLQNSVPGKSVILNGHISRFGTFNDILSNGSEDRSVLIGFEIEPIDSEEDRDVLYYQRYYGRFGEEYKRVNCEFTFTDTIKGKSSEILQLQPKLERSYLKVEYKQDQRILELEVVKSQKNIDDRISELRLNEKSIQRNELATLEYEVKKPFLHAPRQLYHHVPVPTNAKLVGASLNHFLPKVLSVVFDKVCRLPIFYCRV